VREPSDRADSKDARWPLPAGIGPITRPGWRPLCPVPPGPGQAPSTAPVLAPGQWQPDGLAGLAAFPAQAAAITARWQPEKDAICLIGRSRRTQPDANATGIVLLPRHRYGPELRLDAAGKAPGDLQAGQRMVKQEAGTEEAAAGWRRRSLPTRQPAPSSLPSLYGARVA